MLSEGRAAVLGVVAEQAPYLGAQLAAINRQSVNMRRLSTTGELLERCVPFNGGRLPAWAVTPHEVVDASFDLVTSRLVRRAVRVLAGGCVQQRAVVLTELLFVATGAAGGGGLRCGHLHVHDVRRVFPLWVFCTGLVAPSESGPQWKEKPNRRSVLLFQTQGGPH